MIHTRNCAYHF